MWLPGTYISPAETGLYYLESRYYNPEIGRFINADSLVSTGQGLLGYNMFAYCNNNPVNSFDPSGQFAIATFLVCLAVGSVVGAGLGALSAVQQGTDIWRGALTGALLGGGIGVATGLALADAPGGIAAGIGKVFLKAGIKSSFGKFAADLTAYASAGKELGSIESYMSAFAFGGSMGALGLKGGWKKAADIFVRPVFSMLVDDMLFKGQGWDGEDRKNVT